MSKPRDIAIKRGFIVGALVECEDSARHKFEGQGSVDGYNGGTVEVPIIKVKLPTTGVVRNYSTKCIRLASVEKDNYLENSDTALFVDATQVKKEEPEHVGLSVIENGDVYKVATPNLNQDDNKESSVILEITRLLKEFGITDRKVILIPKDSRIIDLTSQVSD